MKRILAFAAAPFIVSAALAGASLAGDGEKTDSNAAIDADTPAAATGVTDFGMVISAIQTSGETASEIEDITDASHLRVIRVSDIAEAESTHALENALSQNRAEVNDLREAIRANAVLSMKLEQERVLPDDVVAAVEVDGELVIYVR